MLAATGVVLIVGGQSPASVVVLSLTVVAASLVALGTYRALSPLVGSESALTPPPVLGRTRVALERDKALALRLIKELEFDYAMKKIAKSDFEEMSARLRTRAIALMRRLDEGVGYREEIEREIHRRLGPTGATGATGATSEGATGAVCECGTTNDSDAKFCKNCGSRLVAA